MVRSFGVFLVLVLFVLVFLGVEVMVVCVVSLLGGF